MKYDVAIIGGGPAGLMAAVKAGESGFKVVLLEKNLKLGVKLLLTGGGRANVANFNSVRNIAKRFGNNGKWLLSALSRFGPEELINFFNDNNLETKIEDDGRIFPKSNYSQEVLNVFLNLLKKYNVTIKLNSELKKIISKKNNNKIEKVILKNGEEIIAENYIISTGGKSYPVTGSTGDGYIWLKKLGHDIIKPRPALVAIKVKNQFIKDLEGLSLQKIEVSYFKKNKKICSERGDLIFTNNGLSGPVIFNISNWIDQKNYQNSKIVIDLFPDLDFYQLDKDLQLRFNNKNKSLKNSLVGLVSGKLITLLSFLLKIDPQKKVNLITKIERQSLVKNLKKLELDILELDNFAKAMLTAGGVNIKEINPKNMKSKIINNLYIAGELIDLNGPTGGYNLQLSWTTGYIAGQLL